MITDGCDRLPTVDFDDSVLVVVESSWESSPVEHRWARAEAVRGGLYRHGYHTAPYERHADRTTRLSVLAVERPNGPVEGALVSLTVSPDRRVHVASSVGVVAFDS